MKSANRSGVVSAPYSAVRAHLDVIVAAFGHAFGGAVPHVIIQPDPDDAQIVSVCLDISHADKQAIDDARASGARVVFYDEIVARIPSDLLNQISFDFIFPR